MQTTDLIESIVKELTVDVIINSQVTATGLITILTDCTYWITTSMNLTIKGNIFVVDSFIKNESFVLKPELETSTIIGTTITLPAPTFLHGTLKMVRSQVSDTDDKMTILPLVWLYEIIIDKKERDEESMIDRESELIIIFFNHSDSDWSTNEHYKNVIDTIETMVKLFIDKVSNSRFFTDEFKYKESNLLNTSITERATRTGVFENTQEKSIFDCGLTGIGVNLFSHIRKDLSCTTNKC